MNLVFASSQLLFEVFTSFHFCHNPRCVQQFGSVTPLPPPADTRHVRHIHISGPELIPGCCMDALNGPGKWLCWVAGDWFHSSLILQPLQSCPPHCPALYHLPS
eukprot:EG_transcript_34420